MKNSGELPRALFWIHHLHRLMKTGGRRLLFFVQVSRPIIWSVLPLVYALGLHESYASVGFAAVLQMLLLSFPMNLVGCGLNDIYDYESDRLSSRRRVIWGAVVRDDDRPLVMRACIAMVPLIVLSAVFTGNWLNIVATVLLVAVAWLYSVPPVRLKERPPLDSLANGLGFFLLPFVMGYSLGADPRVMPVRYYLLALCVAGIHALASAADYEADRAAGHRTMAVVFGRRTAIAAACAAFFAARLAGEFHTTSVNAYLAVCATITLVATILPIERVIAATCATVFAGFIIAAAFHIAGW
jgi:4-hydroxybenzoate polyprenyltransferase